MNKFFLILISFACLLSYAKNESLLSGGGVLNVGTAVNKATINTDSMKVRAVNTTKLTADDSDTGSFTLNLFDNGGIVRATGIVSYAKIGNQITWYIPAISTAYMIDHISGFPSKLRTRYNAFLSPLANTDLFSNAILIFIYTGYIIGANDTAWTTWTAHGLGTPNLPMQAITGFRFPCILNYRN